MRTGEDRDATSSYPPAERIGTICNRRVNIHNLNQRNYDTVVQTVYPLMCKYTFHSFKCSSNLFIHAMQKPKFTKKNNFLSRFNEEDLEHKTKLKPNRKSRS
jgi:hypothetical protein